jgi:hypothetical protein
VGNPGAAREQLRSLLRSVPHSIFQTARAYRTQRTTVCERRARVWRVPVCTEMLRRAVEARRAAGMGMGTCV